MYGKPETGGGANGSEPRLLCGERLRIGVAHITDTRDQRLRLPLQPDEISPGHHRAGSSPPDRAPSPLGRSAAVAAMRDKNALNSASGERKSPKKTRPSHAAASASTPGNPLGPRWATPGTARPAPSGPAKTRPVTPGQPDLLAGPHQQRRQGQQQTALPARASPASPPAERHTMLGDASRHRHTVCAASHSMSRTIGPVGFCRLPPIDARHRVAGHERAELPESCHRCRCACGREHALGNRRGNALGGNHQGRGRREPRRFR